MVTELDNTEYGEYYTNYIKLVHSNSLLEELEKSVGQLCLLLDGLSNEKANYRYEEGKWSIKELIQHLIDTEKVCIYRALRFVRNDFQELLGYDHDAYVDQINVDDRKLEDLLDELILQRKLTLTFYRHLNQMDLLKIGVANGSNLSVRAIGYIQVGHVLHHTRIIKERYL